MELKFTPRSIKELEQKAKVPFTELIGKYSITNLLMIIESSPTIANEQEASDVMQKEMEAGKDALTIYVDVLEMLQNDGFLPKMVSLKEVRSALGGTQGLPESLLNMAENIASQNSTST